MHTLTLNVKNDAYESIAYFLKNLSNDVEIVNHNMSDEENEKSETIVNLRGVFKQYANNSKLAQENDAWENHIIEQYKKDN
jgi:hypothetical protein